jgi:hypothetical protein
MQIDHMESVSYDAGQKAIFHRQADAALRRLAAALGINDTPRHNQGGIAVSGEITLHSESLYVQIAQTFGSLPLVMYRTCEGKKDYSGGTNNFCTVAELAQPDTIARLRSLMP